MSGELEHGLIKKLPHKKIILPINNAFAPYITGVVHPLVRYPNIRALVHSNVGCTGTWFNKTNYDEKFILPINNYFDPYITDVVYNLVRRPDIRAPHGNIAHFHRLLNLF